MKEGETRISLEKNTELPVQKAPRDFQRDPYLITDYERRVTKLRSDLSQLRDPARLMSQPRWRAFLARSAELIRAIPEQQDSPDMQKLKEQTTDDYNRAIRRLRYEGLKGLPSGLPQHSQPESREPHESSVIQTYGLDLPSGTQTQQDLPALKTRVEAQEKTLEPRAFSIEAQRQRRNHHEKAATYNRWIERQGELESWKQPEYGLKGGIYLARRPNGRLYTHFMTLRDPYGDPHSFYGGETPLEIADATKRWLEENGPMRVVIHARVTEVTALTEEDVQRLYEGASIHGWTCSERRYDQVQTHAVYTDRDTELTAVREIGYQALNRELPDGFQGVVLGDADPSRNCYGDAFLDRRGTLNADGNQIQTILNENGYAEISHAQAQYGDMCIYRYNGYIIHAAPVLGWAQTDNDLLSNPPRLLYAPPEGGWGGQYRLEDYHLKVDSKYGDGPELGHSWDDPGMRQRYGQPTLYRTDRAGGNTLRGA